MVVYEAEEFDNRDNADPAEWDFERMCELRV